MYTEYIPFTQGVALGGNSSKSKCHDGRINIVKVRSLAMLLVCFSADFAMCRSPSFPVLIGNDKPVVDKLHLYAGMQIHNLMPRKVEEVVVLE